MKETLHQRRALQNGFSLVELSVVLVILGLLTGGIIAGHSLIRAAEINKLSSDLNTYVSATLQYRDRYDALPGDHDTAQQYWPGTTQGNGDGYIKDHWGGTAPGIDEDSKAVQHLALAGLINHTPSNTFFPQVVGENIPAGPYPRQGYRLQSFPYQPGCCDIYGRQGYAIIAGIVAPGADVWDGFLAPADAWHIDTKFDDGTPEKGDWINQSDLANQCNRGNGGGDAVNQKGDNEYMLEVDAEDCNVIFLFK